mmetsp:Transcript_92139/g.298014  ORF Transcript_92139/g.298014 Transcript_92139/m.298014 type:complete len:228 (-) Transcript_92139:83-766(-)
MSIASTAASPPPMQSPKVLLHGAPSANMPPMLSPHLPPHLRAVESRDIPPPPLASPVSISSSRHATSPASDASCRTPVFAQVTSTAMSVVQHGSPMVLSSTPPSQVQFTPSPTRSPLLLPMGQPLAQGSLIEVTSMTQAKSPPRFAPPSYFVPVMSPSGNQGRDGAVPPPPMCSPVFVNSGSGTAPRCFAAAEGPARRLVVRLADAACLVGSPAGMGAEIAWPPTPF